LLWDIIPLNPNFGDSPSYSGNYNLGNIKKIDNQSIILTGQSGYNWQPNNGGSLSLIKVDTQGNIFWNKNFDSLAYLNIDAGYGVDITSDEGFIAVGYSSFNSDFESRQTYLVKSR
jgi:hypothetical protein